MSGGIAYVFDERMDFTKKRCNLASSISSRYRRRKTCSSCAISSHVTRNYTGSPKARMILDNWPEMLPRFIKMFPHEFKRALGVVRTSQPYIAGKALPAITMAEQVQHG